MEAHVKFLGSVPYLMCVLVMTAGASGAPKANAGGAGVVATANALGPDAAQDGKADGNLSGKWAMSWTDRKGKEKGGTAQIQQNGSALSGTFQGDRGAFPLTGSLRGNRVSLTVNAPGREVSFTGTVDGNRMSGPTQRGKSWTGTRQ
jgi:hypothetical protein